MIFRISVLQNLRRKSACNQYPMPLQWVVLCMWCCVLGQIFALKLVSRYQSNLGAKHWTTVKHLLKYLRRMRDCVCAPKCWDSLKGDMMVDKIPFVKNLVDLFTKTLSGRVFDGHKDNTGFRWVSNMLYRHDALRASGRMLW